MKKINGIDVRDIKSYKYDAFLVRYIVNEHRQEGISMYELAKKYNVPAQNINRWVKQYSDDPVDQKNDVMTEQEQKDMEALLKQIELLKKKLDHEQMKTFALETMIDLAKTELGVDVRKNFGAKQPKK
jgi:transposase